MLMCWKSCVRNCVLGLNQCTPLFVVVVVVVVVAAFAFAGTEGTEDTVNKGLLKVILVMGVHW